MIEEVLEMGIEKEIETEIETVIEIPENLKENVLYAINLVISPEIVLNQIQEGGTLIRKNPMVFIIGTGEAEVGVEVDPGQEITIIHLVRENHGGTRKIKIIEVDLQVEAGIIIGMIIAKGGKILMNGEKKIPLAVKVEAGAEAEVKEKIDMKTVVESEINIEIMMTEIEVIAEVNTMIKKKRVMAVMQAWIVGVMKKKMPEKLRSNNLSKISNGGAVVWNLLNI